MLALTPDYERARAQGLSTVWTTQNARFDALTLMASWGDDMAPNSVLRPFQRSPTRGTEAR
jgi:hypothetical protein